MQVTYNIIKDNRKIQIKTLYFILPVWTTVQNNEIKFCQVIYFDVPKLCA